MLQLGQRIDDVWISMLRTLVECGENVDPRGMATQEIIGYQSCIDMDMPVIGIKSRNMGYRFMCAEAHWILTGSNQLRELTKYAPTYARFSDDGRTLAGAYGPAVKAQIPYILGTLAHDVNTRQAVMTTWNRSPEPSKDIPCTVSTQFLIRNESLHLLQSMRSSDAWLGYPYDMFSFSMLAAYICIELRKAAYPGLKLGCLLLTSGSQHLYEKDRVKARECIGQYTHVPTSRYVISPIKLREYKSGEELIHDLYCLKDQRYDLTKGTFLHELRSY